MDFLEKHKNLTYYLGMLVVTLWPFLNLFASPVNIALAPYYEFIIIFLFIFGFSLSVCGIIKRIFKIEPIKVLIFYTFFYVSLLYYVPYSECILVLAGQDMVVFMVLLFLFFAVSLFFLFFLSRSKNFHLFFLVFIGVIFVFETTNFLVLSFTERKACRHEVSPDSVAFEFKTKPNIYFLLLDAYPRHDTLLEERDNSSFLQFFKENGFIVANNSYSNYSQTWPSLTSVFQMSYLQEGDIIQSDALSPLKEVFMVLKKNDYNIAIVPSYFPSFFGKNIADAIYRKHDVWTRFYYPILNYFSKSYLQNLITQLLTPYAYFSMDEIERVVFSDKQKPLFTFIHFIHFHDYVFNENCEIDKARLKDVKFHSACFEKFVEKAVNLIVLKDPTAIIITQSDHGAWYWSMGERRHPRRFDRAFGIFSAFRLPNLTLSEGMKTYLQDSPSPVNDFRIIFSLLAEKEPVLLPYQAFLSEPQGDDLGELTLRMELEKLVTAQDFVKAYLSIKDSGNIASDEEIVRFLLESNGYSNWNKLSPADQEWAVAEIVSSAIERLINIEDILKNSQSPNTGNGVPDKGIMKVLLENHGYKGWDKLGPITQEWVVSKIAARIAKINLEALLKNNDFLEAYRSIKNSGNPSSDEEIVKFLLESNGYKNWDKLSSADRKWIVTEIVSGLVEKLIKNQDILDYYSITGLGGTVPDEEITQLLLKNSGYKSWDKLAPNIQKRIVARILSRLARIDLQKLLDSQDFSEAYYSLKNSENPASDEEIVKFLLESNGYKNWEKLTLTDRAAVVLDVMAGTVTKLISTPDTSDTYSSVKGLGNAVSDEEAVKFLLENKGYTIWDKLTPAVRGAIIKKVALRIARVDVEKLLKSQDFSQAYRSIRGTGNKTPDKEIVKFLLESNGYTRWNELTEADRGWVVSEIVSSVVEKLVNGQNFSEAYLLTKNSGNPSSDEEIIKFLLESNGYKDWSTLTPVARNWVVSTVLSRAAKISLEKLLKTQDFLQAYLSIKNSGSPSSDEEIVKFLLESNGYKEWNKLSPLDRQKVMTNITRGNRKN